MLKVPLKLASKFWNTDEDFSSDDETPAHIRLKQLRKTNFPDILASNDPWEKKESSSKNVRYVPIQVESGHPSTSTPIEGRKVRTVPVKLVGLSDNTISPLKPRMHTPVKPVIHAVVDDDEHYEPEVTWVETKNPETSSKKPAKVYTIDLDDEVDHQQEDDVIFVKKVTTPPPTKPYKYFLSKNRDDDTDDVDHQQEDDVIFVKKVTTPPPTKPYKYFLSKNRDDDTDDEPIYLKLSRKSIDRNIVNISPRTYTKFKAPPGITKPYKKPPTPLPRWLQASKPTNSGFTSLSRNRFLGLNGNIRSTLSEVFNLDEKRNYEELIRRVSMKPKILTKSDDIINLAEESASFRLTRRSQKNALNEIKLVEKGLITEKENDASKEYDPITVASINSSDSEIEIVPSESSTSSSVKIDPINSLKDSYRDKAVTSGDWLSKLDTKYRKKRQETQEKLKDARRESDIISKKIAHLEHKLKYELSIPESIYEEPQPSVELPPLTPEQEKLVNRALGPGPPNQLVVEKFNLRIHRRDLQTLAGLNWLNDEVINFYMNLLMQRSEERKDLPKVYATNTFFYPKLMQSGQAGLRRWTRKVDIFSHDLMVVPVHLGVHWCVSLVHFKHKRIHYLDSMGGRNQPALDALLQYLRDEHKDKKGAPFDETGWKTECLKDIPQQMNGSDCGMFACTFSEFSSRDAPYTFSQAHMPYLRRKAALEIMTGKLLL